MVIRALGLVPLCSLETDRKMEAYLQGTIVMASLRGKYEEELEQVVRWMGFASGQLKVIESAFVRVFGRFEVVVGMIGYCLAEPGYHPTAKYCRRYSAALHCCHFRSIRH